MPSQYIEREFARLYWSGSRVVHAADIRIGDLVDLEGDAFADSERDHPAFASELQLVVEVTRETPDCVAIGFEGFDLVGFPPDRSLRVCGHVST